MNERQQQYRKQAEEQGRMGLRHARARDLAASEWHVCNDGVLLCDYTNDYGIYDTEFNLNDPPSGPDWCEDCLKAVSKLMRPRWISGDYGPQFTKKTYGRIWVREEADVARVRDLIKDLDEFEFEYLPNDFVAVWPENPRKAELVYGHKFELRTDLLEYECWRRGIQIYLITGYRDRF